jgi:acetolactate synthase-1/3 small subunit
VDVSSTSYTLEITGNDRKIQAVIDLLSPIGIMEIVRTGKVAISRHKKIGPKSERDTEEESE